MWERGFAPVGFLVLLVTLFLSHFSLPENTADAGHSPRTAAEGGVVPSPLSVAGDELWFPASGHAERRVAKAKTGLPEGDAGGKALVACVGALLYPFEIASSEAFFAVDDAAPVSSGNAAFRSRAPPALSV